MNTLLKPGRMLYGIGIAALGIHQVILGSFRPDIVPPFRWANQYAFLPVLTGVALIIAGIIISGLIVIKSIDVEKVSLYVAYCFGALIVTFQLPYILIAGKPSQLATWFAVGETMAYCGGALLMANSFTRIGEILFCFLIIMFGFSHFVYTDMVATMIPKFFGSAVFWTYLVGVLLISAGVAIVLRFRVKTVSLLLAVMLLLFFIIFHVPDAIANPTAGGGNEIVRAIVCLLFTGIALQIYYRELNTGRS